MSTLPILGRVRRPWRSTACFVALALILLSIAAGARPTHAFDGRTVSVDGVDVTEGSGGGFTDVVFTLLLDGPAVGNEVVQVQTQDATAMVGDLDYEPLPPTDVHFAAGVTSTTVTVRAVADDFLEAAETFFLQVTSGQNIIVPTDTFGRAALLADEPGVALAIPRVSLGEGSVVAPEGVVMQLNMPVSAEAQADSPCGFRVTFTHVETDDNDFVTPPTFLDAVLEGNHLATSVGLLVNGDGTDEPTERIGATITSHRVGAAPACFIFRPNATGTIFNVDFQGSSITVDDATVDEGDSGTTTLAVLLHKDLNSGAACAYTVSLSGTGTSSLASTTVPPQVFEQNAFGDEFLLEIVGDTVVEPDVAFTVTIAIEPNQPTCRASDAVAVISIRDDDGTPPPPPADTCAAGDKVVVTWPGVTLGRTPSTWLVRTADAAVQLPAGVWSVKLTSYDKHHGADGINQLKERWNIRLLDGSGAVLDHSGFIADLPSSSTTISRNVGTVESDGSVVTIRAAHILAGTPTSKWGNTQSIVPVKAVLTCTSPL